MRIEVFAVGTRMPGWVADGVDAYRKRLPRHIRLDFIEIPSARRSPRTPVDEARQKEEQQLLKRARRADRVIALDERGAEWTSIELAEQMRRWQASAAQVAFLIGGPDGLTDACRREADTVLSLSRLTLPHGLVRVVLAEQLYRAWTILQGHPYHRE